MSDINFNSSFEEASKDTYLIFLQEFSDLTRRIDIFINNALKNSEIDDSDALKNILYKIKENKDYLVENCQIFFKKNREYLTYRVLNKNILTYMAELGFHIPDPSLQVTPQDLTTVLFPLQDLAEAFKTIYIVATNENHAKELILELEEQVEKATNSVKSVISAKEALESKQTEEIYSKAAKKYINTARFYDVLLVVLLGFFYYLTSKFFENFQMISIFQAIKKSSSEAQTLAIFFFITKLTIVSIVITLATIFIRRSSHFRKLHDQANQTSLELNALPNYLRQVDSEHHSEIYKEMIPKFFGKELDQSQNDKVGDLVKDQLAAGTELIKASAEIIKNAKSLSGSVDKTKNAKSHSTSTDDKSKPDSEA